MKKKISFNKLVLFLFMIIEIIGLITSILFSYFLNDFGYLYGFLLFNFFGSINFCITYKTIRWKGMKGFVIFMYIIRNFFLVLPILIVLLLYLNFIYKINVLGLLIGVIIFSIEILALYVCFYKYNIDKTKTTNVV